MASKNSFRMTKRQCEIAAESYAACLLAQAGYDVLVQYGANQPEYDLAAVKGARKLLVSVKGSQDGGWPLALGFRKQGVSIHNAINAWQAVQRPDLIYVVVQFLHVALGEAPRTYVARPVDIVAQLRAQYNGKGHVSLQEDWERDHPGSASKHKIPASWLFTQARIDSV